MIARMAVKIAMEEFHKVVPDYVRVEQDLAWMPSSTFRSPLKLRSATNPTIEAIDKKKFRSPPKRRHAEPGRKRWTSELQQVKLRPTAKATGYAIRLGGAAQGVSDAFETDRR